VLSDASFVVTWRADGSQDGSDSGIFAQRFAANGAALGSEFRINTHTANNQSTRASRPSPAAASW
jgi:hypothetical protein